MKPMTFEEWYNLHNMAFWTWKEDAKRHFFDTARQGTIPEDEAIKIPPVEEWPGGANSIRMCYSSHTPKHPKDWHHTDDPAGMVQYIPRPDPAWTPKVGEAVFARMADTTRVGKVISADIKANYYYVRTQDGLEDGYGGFCLKPFDPAKIGLPWDEI